MNPGTASSRSAVSVLGTFTVSLRSPWTRNEAPVARRRTGSLRGCVARLVPLRPGVVFVHVVGELFRIARRAVGGDEDLHLLAHQLLPLLARHFLGARHLVALLARLAGGVDGHVLGGRHLARV